jgi:hypothetical protein
MDFGTVVARAAAVISNPKKEFWEEQLRRPVEAEFFDAFYIPFAGLCGVLVSLPYIAYGLVPAIMMGLLSGGIVWAMPYVMSWAADSVATGMGGVGYGAQTRHIWALLQVPLGLGLALGAISERFQHTQTLTLVGLGYSIYLSTLFTPEMHRIDAEKRVGFLVITGAIWFFLLLIGRAFLVEVTQAMWLSSLQSGVR